jgi:hypothetical protein
VQEWLDALNVETVTPLETRVQSHFKPLRTVGDNEKAVLYATCQNALSALSKNACHNTGSAQRY